MEGVPVKISEKYKPLPKIYVIPQVVAARLNVIANHYDESPQFLYDFELEKNVLSKVADWKKCRENVQNNQRERRERRETQKFHDIEDKQKRLLTAVSYPSTDDLSSESDNADDNSGHCNNIASINSTSALINKGKVDTNTTNKNSFDTILQPTILSQNTMVKPCTVQSLYNSNNINYSDFESDTSSPFDNIELKTINDLDILAQVLHNTSVQKEETVQNTELSTKLRTPTDDGRFQNSCHHVRNKSSIYLNDNNITNIPHQSSLSSPNNFNNFYMSNTIPSFQVFPQEQGTYESNQITNHHHLRNHILVNYDCAPSLNPHNHESNSKNGIQSSSFANDNLITSFSAIQSNKKSFLSDHLPAAKRITIETDSSTNAAKYKSQSVPDILKELENKTLTSEDRRIRNYSHTVGSVNSEINTKSGPLDKSSEINYYTQLEGSIQEIVQRISLMGYSLERVSKIALILGKDDKKIVEHLIILDELIDLGFEESKISEALLKFNNNKEKALESLIQ